MDLWNVRGAGRVLGRNEFRIQGDVGGQWAGVESRRPWCTQGAELMGCYGDDPHESLEDWVWGGKVG